MKKPSNLGALVDALGAVRAQIHLLNAQEAALKASIAEAGEGEHEGDAYTALVLETERHHLDMAAVRAKLSPQFIKAHTTVATVVTVRCKERSAEPLLIDGF